MSFCISPSTHFHYFQRKNKVFQSKTFSNLIFGDDFAFDGPIWLYYDSLFVSGSIWNPPPCWRTKENMSGSQSRSKEHGSLLTQNANLRRRSLLIGIHYSKHSRIKISKYCCKIMGAPNWLKKCIRISSSLEYIEKLLGLWHFHVRMLLNVLQGRLIMSIDQLSIMKTKV